MSQVESPLGALDIESSARHEWLSWTKMADVEREAPPVLVGGDGPYVIEADGTRLLDAMSGLFTTQIGYSHGARDRRRGGGPDGAPRLLPELGGHQPGDARADRAHPRARAAADGARVLHLGRLRVGRVGLEAGAPALPGARRELAPHRDLAPRLLPRLLARSPLDHGHPGRARRPSSRSCPTRATSSTPIRARTRAAIRWPPPTRSSRRSSPRARERLHGHPRARPERRRHARAAARLRAARARDLRPPRRAAVLRRGDLRVRAPRALVRLGAARLHARPDHVREGRHVRLCAARRRDLQRGRRGAAAREPRACTPTATRSAAIRSRARSRSPTSRSWSASARSPTCSRSSRTSRACSTRSPPSSPIAVEARGCGFFRSLELVDAALVDRVRAATRARGVIVRTDVRANPCLAISPPLISDRSQVDEIAEALAGGLAEIAG